MRGRLFFPGFPPAGRRAGCSSPCRSAVPGPRPCEGPAAAVGSLRSGRRGAESALGFLRAVLCAAAPELVAGFVISSRSRLLHRSMGSRPLLHGLKEPG